MDERFLQPYREIVDLRSRARRALGVSEDAGLEDIKQAFRRLARTCHPDVAAGRRDFTRIVNAYLVLTRSDPRGFVVGDEAPSPSSVPSTPEEYFRWWRERFSP